MALNLSHQERDIIEYCAAVRGVSSDIVPNYLWVHLVDALAIAAGVSDVRRRCLDCRNWQLAGFCSGEDHGRGLCSRLSHEGLEYSYLRPVYTGEWNEAEENYGRVQNVRETTDFFTKGEFCCNWFMPRKK